MNVIWSKHARKRLPQRGGKIGRTAATAEILAAIEEGRASGTPPRVLDRPANQPADTLYAWSPDLNRIYVLAQSPAELTVITVLLPTVEGRLRELRLPRVPAPAGLFDGVQADRPEDLPLPPNADKRYDELDGG